MPWLELVVAGWVGIDADVSARGVSSLMLYLAIYSFMTFGAFAMVAILRKGWPGGRKKLKTLRDWPNGIRVGHSSCWCSWCHLAGIPPTAGFIGKFYLFMTAVNAGLAWLAIFGLIFATISAFYYLRIVMVMYMREPSPEQERNTRLVLSPQVSVVLAFAVAGVVLLGIFPGPLVSIADLSVLSVSPVR